MIVRRLGRSSLHAHAHALRMFKRAHARTGDTILFLQTTKIDIYLTMTH